MFKKCLMLSVLVSSLGSLCASESQPYAPVAAQQEVAQQKTNYHIGKRAKIAGYYVLQGHAAFQMAMTVFGSAILTGVAGYKTYDAIAVKGVKATDALAGVVTAAHMGLGIVAGFIGSRYLYNYWQKKREAVESQLERESSL